MADLIERDDALKTVNAEFQAFRNYECYANTHKAIQAIPAVKINSATDNVAINLLIGIRKFDNISEAAKAALDKAIEALSIPAAFRWIPCSERLPDNIGAVLITWANRKPEPYQQGIKDKPFTGVAHYCNGKWWWYSSTCEDYLAEYGRSEVDAVDKDIDVLAWMPMPDTYKPPEKE